MKWEVETGSWKELALMGVCKLDLCRFSGSPWSELPRITINEITENLRCHWELNYLSLWGFLVQFGTKCAV